MEDDPPPHEMYWWYKSLGNLRSTCNKRNPLIFSQPSVCVILNLTNNGISIVQSREKIS